MNEIASREILWNVGTLPNVIAMYAFMLLAMAIGLAGIWRQVELWSTGKPAPEYLGNYLSRFCSLFKGSFLQHGVVRDKSIAIAHTLVYLGFLALLFATTMVLIDHDLGYFFPIFKIYHGNFYLGVTVLSDILGFAALIGCLIIAYRRYIKKPDQIHNRPADSFFLIVLVLMIVQGFALEGLRIHATSDPWANYSPIGLAFAKSFWFLSDSSTLLLHYLLWWFHTLTVFAVIAILPYTKFFHLIASSINLYFKDSGRAKGELKSPGNIEELIEAGEDFSLGADSIKDYTWKQLMDLDACTSCGRCQAACPAYNSGKPLSPKWLILDTRNHALTLNADEKLGSSIVPKIFRKLDRWLTLKFFLKSSGVEFQDGEYKAAGEYRAENPEVQNSVFSIGKDGDVSIAGDVLNQDVFWSCTTCYACVEACPVGINHVDQIVENRRNMVLMKGQMPSEAQAALRTMETQQNPYGPADDRIKWFEELDIPVLKEGDEVDYLYWVGCVSAYDPRKQKIAKSLVKIMKAANLSFGVLGKSEACTGDPARRLGEENLFQTLAKYNIELLKTIKFHTIVANCPHCFNTIKNEYPQFGNLGNGKSPKIIHHSKLLQDLMASEQIKLSESAEKYTFHDPCYLGRYNDEYDAPRETVKRATGLNILEMDQNKNKGMCCGAGGGHFWFDMKQGERINTIRVNQAAETGASKIATACPFCLQMMEDGVKLTDREEELEVKDIAEVVAENLEN